MELTLEDMERELAEAERRLREDVKIGLPTGQKQLLNFRSSSHAPAKLHSQSGRGITSKAKNVTFANTPQVIKVSNESNVYRDRFAQIGEENFSRNTAPRSPILEHAAAAAATALKMSRDLREREERDRRVLQMLREQENALGLQNKEQHERVNLQHFDHKQHQEQQTHDRVEANKQQTYQHHQRTSDVDQHQRQHLHSQHEQQSTQRANQNIYIKEDKTGRPPSPLVKDRVRACDDDILLPVVRAEAITFRAFEIIIFLESKCDVD